MKGGRTQMSKKRPDMGNTLEFWKEFIEMVLSKEKLTKKWKNFSYTISVDVCKINEEVYLDNPHIIKKGGN